MPQNRHFFIYCMYKTQGQSWVKVKLTTQYPSIFYRLSQIGIFTFSLYVLRF